MSTDRVRSENQRIDVGIEAREECTDKNDEPVSANEQHQLDMTATRRTEQNSGEYTVDGLSDKL